MDKISERKEKPLENELNRLKTLFYSLVLIVSSSCIIPYPTSQLFTLNDICLPVTVAEPERIFFFFFFIPIATLVVLYLLNVVSVTF